MQVLLVRTFHIAEILPARDGILVGFHPSAGETSDAIGHDHQRGFEAQMSRLCGFEARNPA